MRCGRALRSKRLEHDDLADASIACAGDGAGQDDDAGEDAERGQELDDVGDLEQDLADGLKRGGDVDDGDGGKVLVEGAAQL